MSPHCKPAFIALTGFMGSGKSSVGKALASLLGWNFADLDAEIERIEGRKVREIFAIEGESRFREIEVSSLRAVLTTLPRPTVLATGGGTYVQPRNAELLRAAEATVVFLEASPEILLQRCWGESEPGAGIRPLALDRGAFLRLHEQRLPAYRTANLTVVSENKPPAAVARQIAQSLGLLKT